MFPRTFRQWAQRVPEFCVLMYHSIEPDPVHHQISTSVLEKQLAFLKKNYRIVSSEELETRLRLDKPLQRTAVLTFDDGHADLYLYVLPVLERLGIPATFFVSTRHCNPGQYLWRSILWAFREFYHKDCLEIEGRRWSTRTRQERCGVSSWLLRRHLGAGLMGLTGVLQREMPPLEFFVPQNVLTDYMAGLSVEQLRRVAASPYVELAAHTVTHPFLARCSSDVKERECRESIEFLRAATGREIRTFSYPMGSYDTETIGILRKNGIQRAFTAKSLFGPDRLYEIPRVSVGSSSLFAIDLKYRRMPKAFRIVKALYYGLNRSGDA